MIKNILFDFDGTIADTFDQNVRIIAKLLKLKADAKTLKHFRDMSLLQILKEMKVSKIKLVYLHFRAKRISKRLNKPIVVFRGMKTVINRLSKDCRIIIVSSAPTKVIRRVIDKNALDIDAIAGGASLANKSRKIQSTLRKFKFKKSETIYVGDEIRDIEACRRVGIKCIAVSWGYNARKALHKAAPKYMADVPRDLIKIVEKHNKSYK